MRRVVTSYSLHRSASGRLSSGVDSSEPDKLRGKVSQLQNVPKPVRDIVVALPGYILVAGDWSAIEWCISMWMASKYDKDRFHLDILDKFQAGKFDPHKYLASFANNVPESEVTNLMRKEAKPYTHGRTYMGSARTLARNAGQPDSVGIRVCGAHETAFRVHPWQKEVVAACKKKKYVQTPLGWRRYFWGQVKNPPELAKIVGMWTPKPSEVIATLVSGTAADLCKVVLNRIFETLSGDWEVLTTCHDSIMLMVPLADEDQGKQWLRTCMEMPIPCLDNRSWRSDIKTGPDWKSVS